MLTLVIGNKNYSSWSLRPWLALRVFSIPFSEILVPLYTPTSRAALLKHSPSARVPVLHDDALTIHDSSAILAHLAERFPCTPWWPSEPAARAEARSISAEMASGFAAMRQHMPMDLRAEKVVRGLGDAEAEALEQDLLRVRAIWREARARFGQGGNFLFGDFCIADAVFAPVVWRFVGYGVAMGKVEREYVEAMIGLEAMQEWKEDGMKEVMHIAGTDALYT